MFSYVACTLERLRTSPFLKDPFLCSGWETDTYPALFGDVLTYIELVVGVA